MARKEKTIRIATVYYSYRRRHDGLFDMSDVRWLRMSQALAGRGFEVDMIVHPEHNGSFRRDDVNLVSYNDVDWNRYDVIKTLFHHGIDELVAAGVGSHPFIISKLGSVVGPDDATDGVFFYGEEREKLYQTQKHIAAASRYISILTESSRRLWVTEHGRDDAVLMVPTGVDHTIPPRKTNPYVGIDGKIAVYIGNIYLTTQREINLLWQDRLNRIGRKLRRQGIRLVLVGNGRTDKLDADAVQYLGPVDHELVWDYQYFADVGIVLGQGPVQHNESSKLYNYLRSGLPAVCEDSVPNTSLIADAGLGFVTPYGNDDHLAQCVVEATTRSWDRQCAIAYMLAHHTWRHRADIYRRLICTELGVPQKENTVELNPAV